MTVVIAIDSFKGSLTSISACETAKKAVNEVFGDAKTIVIPIADGGEGTSFAYRFALGGRIEKATVTSPNFKKVTAEYTILPDNTAVIEMAQASGLTLMKNKMNAGDTTSYGTGELIIDAIEKGSKKFIIGLGGSATNDGGVGALAALGIRFCRKDGNVITPTGNGLSELNSIDIRNMNSKLNECSFTLACDVENVICGPEGATYVYGKQKGAQKKDIITLDHNLSLYADIVEKYTGRNINNIKRGGAAGGLCAGLMGFLNAKAESGINLFLEIINFDSIVSVADFIISGEGKVDYQTAFGKVVCGIGEYAKKYNKPLFIVAGQLEDGYQAVFKKGITAAFSTLHIINSYEYITKRADKDLFDTVKNICNIVNLKF